jgi:hypothetical protein
VRFLPVRQVKNHPKGIRVIGRIKMNETFHIFAIASSRSEHHAIRPNGKAEALAAVASGAAQC